MDREQLTFMADVTFRPCVPEDVELAIPLIYASGPTSFDFVFKNKKYTSLDFLRHAFITKGGEFSYDNHIAMIIEHKLCGIGTAFSYQQAKSFYLHDALKIIKLYKFQAPSVMARGLKVEQIIKLPTKDEVILGHLAIRPELRSRGYGQMLMEQLMSTTPLASGDYFALDVSELNPRAEALYERMGFQVIKQMKSELKNEFGYVANHRRMVRRE